MNSMSADKKEGVHKLKCFVMMPFGSNEEYSRGNTESNYVYNYIILPGIKEFEGKSNTCVNITREVDKNISGSITKGILKSIASAEICIVDITGQNPNVFFELGIRYSLRQKTTILLKQSDTPIPFDIQGYRCITYDCFTPGPAISELSDFLLSSYIDAASVDSLIFETFPKMQVNIPGILTSFKAPIYINTLSWADWWERLREVSSLLRGPFDNGYFVPEAILGISNGGLVLADFLGREVLKGKPILSLWANRWLDANSKSSLDQACIYFDNEYNKSTLRTIKEMHPNKKDSFTILLTDDIVFTSNTINQAIIFIKRELGVSCKILFTPMYANNIDYLNSISNNLPFGYEDGRIFGIRREDYLSQLTTPKNFLPYGKSLGRE